MANVNKTVTNIPLVREAGTTVTATALTSDTSADDTETLVITPTGPGNRIIVIINNVSAGGSMTAECAAGDYWAALAMSTVTIAQQTAVAIIFQAAAHKNKTDNKINLVLHPVSGGKLVTTHAATWQCFQMPD